MSLFELTAPPSLAPLAGWRQHGGQACKARQLFFGPHVMIIAGEPGTRRIYRVVNGCVALSQLLRDGRRQIIDIVGPGRLFGFGGSEHMACMAESLTYTSLDVAPATLAQDVLNDEMTLFLDRILNHTTLLGRKNAREKVATAVLDLLDQFARKSSPGRKQPLTFNLYLSRSDLADWLGLTIETVSRCLNQMKRDGILAFRQPEIITVLDLPRLRETACFVPAPDPAKTESLRKAGQLDKPFHTDSNRH